MTAEHSTAESPDTLFWVFDAGRSIKHPFPLKDHRCPHLSGPVFAELNRAVGYAETYYGQTLIHILAPCRLVTLDDILDSQAVGKCSAMWAITGEWSPTGSAECVEACSLFVRVLSNIGRMRDACKTDPNPN